MLFERFERPLPDGSLFKLTFQDDEVNAVSAAYKERIHALHSKGNSGSVSKTDELIASADGSVLIRHCSRLDLLVEVLEEFAERTGEIISEIPDITAVPAFKNKDVVNRQKLGRIARELSQLITESQEDSIEPSQADTEDIHKGFDELLRENSEEQ